MNLDDTQVITSIREGAPDAFSIIVERYQQPIVRYLYRLTSDWSVAEDLAQDTFVNAYRGIAKTREELSFKAWLYRIATNNARQYHRRRRLISFIPFIAGERSDPEDPRASVETIDARIEVERALQAVPWEQREPIVLHHIEGLKYREIAEVLGISEEAVRKRVARGSEAFRKAFGARDGGEVR